MTETELLPDIIYHYTSLEVLLQLLTNIKTVNDEQCLIFHASNIFSMNDSSEFLHGYKILWDALKAFEKRNGNKEYNLTTIWDNMGKGQEECEQMLINHIYQKHEAPYVMCFSRQKDFLPLWSMYAQNGRGVNLGFARDNIRLRFNETRQLSDIKVRQNLTCTDVEYSTSSLSSYRKQLKETYDKYMAEISNAEPAKMLEIKVNYLSFMCVMIAPFIKTSAFQFEDEVRLFQYKSKNDVVRNKITSAGMLKPYIEVAIPVKYLKAITLGPCCKQPLVDKFLRTKLNELDLSDVQINNSSITYRNI